VLKNYDLTHNDIAENLLYFVSSQTKFIMPAAFHDMQAFFIYSNVSE
jgi:hypothetical protein